MNRGWRSALTRAAVAVVSLCLIAPARAATPPPGALLTPAASFNATDHIVSATVFHWFGATDGQQIGPWRPLEGRPAWDGSVDFFKRQIKDIMDANIQVMYVHLMGDPAHEQKRVNLFAAASQLRAQGYNVPKIAPFYDVPLSILPEFGYPQPLDLATTAGKDGFVANYKRFFNQYYSVNTDAYADDYLYRIGNKPVLDVWHLTPETVTNRTSLTRADVESRLQAEFSAAHPMFNNGTYQVATALNPGIEMPYADERIPQFEVNEYIRVVTANGVRTAQLKGGYWDQNIGTRNQSPSNILKRNGGVDFANAWNTANNGTNVALNLRRINIESWNEYDEGSGIYEANTGPPYIHPDNVSGNTDTWSSTNNPREYIDRTTAGARTFNSIVDRDAKFLWDNFPTKMYAGTTWNVSAVVRNEGDLAWTAAQNYKLGQQEIFPGETVFGAGRFLMDDTQDEIPKYGGIFRGRPKQFDINIVAPNTTGTYSTHWSMVQENVAWFGQLLTRQIQVLGPKFNGDTDVDSDVDNTDIANFAAGWRRPSGADWLMGDFDSDHDVDRADFNLLAANYPGGATQARLELQELVTHWGVNASGEWQAGGNWAGSPAGSPAGVNATATFGNVISANTLVFTTAPVTLGTITFDSPHTYVLAGLGSLTMQVSGGSALIEVFQGTQKINLPLTIASNTELSVAGGSTLLVSDPVTINAGKSLTKTGAGTVTYQSNVTLGAGASFAIAGFAEVAALSLGSDAKVDVAGSLLLRDRNLVDVIADLRDGRITSSAAAGDEKQVTALGAADDGDGVLIKYTYAGDANLNGTVELEDFRSFVLGYTGAAASPSWTSGDFDYTGAVHADDFDLFLRGLIHQDGGPRMTAEFFDALNSFVRSEGLHVDLTAVPEPSPLVLCAIAALLGTSWRRRQVVRM